MIKAAIFDIDNTLYSLDKANETAMSALGIYVEKNFGMEPEETRRLAGKCMDIVAQRTGDYAAQHNRLLRYQCFLEQIGSTDYQKAMEMYHVYWDTILAVMEPEPGIVSLFMRLKDAGIKLGIGSDMTAYMQYKKLEKLGVLRYLDFLVMSEEAGAEKPAPRFFDLCVKKAGCRPEECVFIGDNLKKDVIGSTECGLTGTWYNPKRDCSSAERSECASQSVPCRETWYNPGRKNVESAGYPVITSFEDYMRGEGQERKG